jgi:hypothetical protein
LREVSLGDHLLANRFVPAIKEKYPNYDIYAYSNTDGKTFQKEVLNLLYPSFYKEILVIPNKKYKKCVINSQFGEETYNGCIENIPDEWYNKLTSHTKWYNLHIDSLSFLDYDFDWLRYFRFFPKPEYQPEKNKEDYIICHLVSEGNVAQRLEQF